MKTSAYLKELKNQSVADLKAQLVDAKKELFNLRFQNATNQLDNTARIMKQPVCVVVECFSGQLRAGSTVCIR